MRSDSKNLRLIECVKKNEFKKQTETVEMFEAQNEIEKRDGDVQSQSLVVGSHAIFTASFDVARHRHYSFSVDSLLSLHVDVLRWNWRLNLLEPFG